MRYDYQRFFKEKLRAIADGEVILDVGGGERFQKGLAPFRELFRGKRYQTVDNSPAYHPDILADVHRLPVGDSSVDAVICLSVLEHLYDPQRAVEELHRVLKPGGRILVFTHFIYPYHARPGVYADYFRFTEDGLAHLFRDFSSVEVKKQGGYFRALAFFMPFQAGLKPFWEPCAYFLDKLFITERRTTTCGYYIYAVK